MAQGIPSTNQTVPFSREALQLKSKIGNSIEIPGLVYSQYTPTAATVTSGTVTSSGQSLIGALQLGGGTATTLPLGGDAAVTFSSSSGLLASFTTSSFMPTTLNYDQMPVKFVPASGAVLPTGLLANTTYYWQWVSATTGRLALVPGGTVIAYTDAGSGTIYCQAATQYWGSPVLPAGFLQVSDVLAQTNVTTIPSSGFMMRCEILGHKTGTGTNSYTVTPGLLSPAGTFTALTAGSALAAVSAGPFPFRITTDLVVQQYAASSAMVRAVCEMQVFSTTSTNTWSTGIWAKTTSLDLTQPYSLDVRYLAATPAVGEYMEPLIVRMWAYN